MAHPVLKSIPLSELKNSKLNMRHGRKKPDVSDILPSFRTSGVRQTLLVQQGRRAPTVFLKSVKTIDISGRLDQKYVGSNSMGLPYAKKKALVFVSA